MIRQGFGRWFSAGLGAAALVLAVGCDLTDDSGSYDHYTLADPTPADVATLGDGSIELAVGEVVAVTVKAFDAEDKELGELTLSTEADGPMGASPSKNGHVFVFYGRRAGSGSVAVEIDGTPVANITTTVR